MATALATLVGMVPVTLLRAVTPVVFFTINMVMMGLTVETVTRVTRRIPFNGHGVHL